MHMYTNIGGQCKSHAKSQTCNLIGSPKRLEECQALSPLLEVGSGHETMLDIVVLTCNDMTAYVVL